MKDLLFRNLGLKVVALLLAVALWLVIREQVTDVQSDKLPVRVQFVADADSFLWQPVDARGDPVEALAIDVKLEGAASDLSAFSRLLEEARSPVALLDPATFKPGTAVDQVEIRVGDLVMPGPIREGSVRINAAEPDSVRIQWRRIVEKADAAVHPQVEISEPKTRMLARDGIELVARPPATVHVRGPLDKLESVVEGGSVRVMLTDAAIDDLVQRLGNDPVFEDPSVAATLAAGFEGVDVLGGPLEVRVRLSQRAENTVDLPLKIVSDQGMTESHRLEWSGTAQATFTNLPGEPEQISVRLTGSRLALSRQSEQMSGVYLWADPSSTKAWKEELKQAAAEDRPPTLSGTIKVQLRIAGLVEGVKAVDLPSLSVEVQPR